MIAGFRSLLGFWFGGLSSTTSGPPHIIDSIAFMEGSRQTISSFSVDRQIIKILGGESSIVKNLVGNN